MEKEITTRRLEITALRRQVKITEQRAVADSEPEYRDSLAISRPIEATSMEGRRILRRTIQLLEDVLEAESESGDR